MRSQFFISPSIETVVEESADILNTGRSIISFDTADLNYIAKEAVNVLLLEGYGNGSCRISNAIEDAIVKTCPVAKGFDLFSANKILIHLSYHEKKPIFSADLSELTQFADMFQADATVMWGISCDNNLRDDTVTARLIASNLKLSPVKYQHYGNKDIGK